MSRYTHETVVYAPFYIHSFQLVQPHTLVEAEKFNIRYSDPSQIDNIPDRLRWHRYRCGLLQRDVADFAGLDRSTYSSYEEIGRDYYPIEKMLRISELFSIPVTDLLDEYNLFLYNGQGEQINKCAKPETCLNANLHVAWASLMGLCSSGSKTEYKCSKAHGEI